MTRRVSKPVPYSTVKKHSRSIFANLPKQKLPRGLYLVHSLGPLPDRVRKSSVGDGGFREAKRTPRWSNAIASSAVSKTTMFRNTTFRQGGALSRTGNHGPA